MSTNSGSTVDTPGAAAADADPVNERLLDALDAIHLNAAGLIAGVGDDQWSLPTPCSEWNVRQLVNHMGFTNRALGAAARREVPDFAPDDDHLGDDALAGFRRLAAASSAAWRADGALDGNVSIPADMPAVGALSANVLDVGIHCWDLATATEQEHGLTVEQIAVIDRCDRALISAEVRSGGGFGEELEPQRPDALASMLAFVGRRA